MKKALITGITGQDGSYLAELLSKKGYEVWGLMRRTSTDPYMRIENLCEQGKVKIIHGNMRDTATLIKAIEKSQPDEVYNLAAQSHVGVSFDCPDETRDINYTGVERLLAALYAANPHAKFYQASTSEMFGSTPPPQKETSPFAPVSPYAEAKLKAHELVQEYKQQGKFAVSGILFNHESPRRGKHFVTRKVTHSLAKVKLGLQRTLKLGNLEAKRDWGFAGDYVEAMWMMLQQKNPDDYVIATGESHTVREFVAAVAEELDMPITWSGTDLAEVGKDAQGTVIVEVHQEYYRPHEVDALEGDSTKARTILGWQPKVTFKELVAMMVDTDLRAVHAIRSIVDPRSP